MNPSLHCIAALTISSLSASALSQQLPMFRHSPDHAGIWSGLDGGYGGIAWRFQASAPVRSSPVVANGVLYAGASDGQFYAVNVADGSLKWSTNFGSSIASAAAIVGNLGLITTRDDRFIAFDVNRHRTRWSLNMGPDHKWAWGGESGDVYISSANVVGSTAYVGAGSGRVYAVDIASGKPKWTFQTQGRVRSTPAVRDGKVYFGSFDGFVYAVDAKTGKQKWRFKTAGVDLDSSQYGYDRKSVQSSPAVDANSVYVGGRDGWVYCLDSKTGKQRWNYDHHIFWINSSPSVLDGEVYESSSDGRFIQALNAKTGKERWRSDVTNIDWSSPAVTKGTVYSCDQSGVFYAINRANGKVRWQIHLPTSSWSSPWVEKNRVFIGCDDGGIYALNVVPGGNLKKVVYWDETERPKAMAGGAPGLRDYLKGHGYEVLDNKGLASFMTQRVKDRARSVVVFAIDSIPKNVVDKAAANTLFRRYLDSGGKVVWNGLPPMFWPADEKGGRELSGLNRSGPKQLLGVSHSLAIFDGYGSMPTNAGMRWGLSSNWLMSDFGADASSVSTVLAKDERGLATSWIKRFGGPEGTGFVRLFAANQPWAEDRRRWWQVQFAAEYFPAVRVPGAVRRAPG